jgi:hypothetical protein
MLLDWASSKARCGDLRLEAAFPSAENALETLAPASLGRIDRAADRHMRKITPLRHSLAA